MSSHDETILEDYSRLVNELVDARREMSRLNDELRQKEEVLRNILQIAPSIIYAADIAHENLIFCNRSLATELGYSPEDYREETGIPLDLLHPEDRDALAQFRKLPHSDAVSEFHFRAKNAAGTEVWYRLKEKTLPSSVYPGKEVAVGSLDEITELKLNEAALKSKSQRDFLTGLLNRRGFLEAAEERIGKLGSDALLLFIDIDHFKMINDSLGHEVGDEVLKEFAGLLVRALRSDDIPARWGGDEFIVLLSVSGPQSLEAVKTRLQGTIDDFNRVQNRDWKLNISIGHALFEKNSKDTLENLISFADADMYTSRRGKRLE